MNIYVFDHREDRGNFLYKTIHAACSGDYTIYNATSELFLNRNNCRFPYHVDNCIDCNFNPEFQNINLPAIVFVHASNKCSYQFLHNYVNEVQCTIVCYSGEIDKCSAYLEIMDIQPQPANIRGFNLAPGVTDNDINKMWDIKRFVEAVVCGRSNPFEVLQRKSQPPYLSALSILCLGFRAQHGDLENINVNVQQLGLDAMDVWKNVLGSSITVASNNLEKNTFKIEGLISRIYDGSNELTADDLTLVKEAYNSIPACITT